VSPRAQLVTKVAQSQLHQRRNVFISVFELPRGCGGWTATVFGCTFKQRVVPCYAGRVSSNPLEGTHPIHCVHPAEDSTIKSAAVFHKWSMICRFLKNISIAVFFRYTTQKWANQIKSIYFRNGGLEIRNTW